MTDNLKLAGIFRKSVYFFLWCPFMTFTFRILGVFVDELWKTNHATNEKFPARFLPANCAEISKVTSGGGNWILRDLEPPEVKAFDRKYSSCTRLSDTTMKH